MNILDSEGLTWEHYTEGTDDAYPIDYWGALLKARPDGHVDMVYRWEPNAFCHFHRHTAPTTSVVLAGELHVVNVDLATGKQSAPKVRRAGDYAHKEGGDVHMEHGGPEGALVLFNIYAPDGLLVERLSPEGTVMTQVHIDRFLEQKARS